MAYFNPEKRRRAGLALARALTACLFAGQIFYWYDGSLILQMSPYEKHMGKTLKHCDSACLAPRITRGAGTQNAAVSHTPARKPARKKPQQPRVREQKNYLDILDEALKTELTIQQLLQDRTKPKGPFCATITPAYVDNLDYSVISPQPHQAALADISSAAALLARNPAALDALIDAMKTIDERYREITSNRQNVTYPDIDVTAPAVLLTNVLKSLPQENSIAHVCLQVSRLKPNDFLYEDHAIKIIVLFDLVISQARIMRDQGLPKTVELVRNGGWITLHPMRRENSGRYKDSGRDRLLYPFSRHGRTYTWERRIDVVIKLAMAGLSSIQADLRLRQSPPAAVFTLDAESLGVPIYGESNFTHALNELEHMLQRIEKTARNGWMPVLFIDTDCLFLKTDPETETAVLGAFLKAAASAGAVLCAKGSVSITVSKEALVLERKTDSHRVHETVLSIMRNHIEDFELKSLIYRENSSLDMKTIRSRLRGIKISGRPILFENEGKLYPNEWALADSGRVFHAVKAALADMFTHPQTGLPDDKALEVFAKNVVHLLQVRSLWAGLPAMKERQAALVRDIPRKAPEFTIKPSSKIWKKARAFAHIKKRARGNNASSRGFTRAAITAALEKIEETGLTGEDREELIDSISGTLYKALDWTMLQLMSGWSQYIIEHTTGAAPSDEDNRDLSAPLPAGWEKWVESSETYRNTSQNDTEIIKIILEHPEIIKQDLSAKDWYDVVYPVLEKLAGEDGSPVQKRCRAIMKYLDYAARAEAQAWISDTRAAIKDALFTGSFRSKSSAIAASVCEAAMLAASQTALAVRILDPAREGAGFCEDIKTLVDSIEWMDSLLRKWTLMPHGCIPKLVSEGPGLSVRGMAPMREDQDDRPLVRNDFEIQKGQTAILVGPNYAGKTELLRQIARASLSLKTAELVNAYSVTGTGFKDVMVCSSKAGANTIEEWRDVTNEIMRAAGAESLVLVDDDFVSGFGPEIVPFLEAFIARLCTIGAAVCVVTHDRLSAQRIAAMRPHAAKIYASDPDREFHFKQVDDLTDLQSYSVKNQQKAAQAAAFMRKEAQFQQHAALRASA